MTDVYYEQHLEDFARRQREFDAATMYKDSYRLLCGGNVIYYSIVQYCPCRMRSERINVGLVLCRPKNDIPFNEWVLYASVAECVINTVFVDDLSRVNRLFNLSDDDAMFLVASMASMKSRLEEIHSLCEFNEYAISRANDLRITEPRMMVIDRDILTLFNELVL